MYTAPPLPPEAKRPGRAIGTVSVIGLGIGAAFLLFVNLVLFILAARFAPVSPDRLYHIVWETTPQHIYDPAALKSWTAWEHKYDGKLKTSADATKAITEMLDSVKDRYTYFMDADAVKADSERSQGTFTGIGMVLGVQIDAKGEPVKALDGKPLPEADKDGYPVIKQLIAGGPAKQSGLKVGDALTAVNGKDTRHQSLDQIIKQIRGKAGTQVTLGVRRSGQDSTITVMRQQINIPAVTTKHLPNGIGYLRLEDFAQWDATDEFKAGLADLKDCKALIIDLRGNPGGFVHNAVNIASLFIEQGTVVTIKSRLPGDPNSPQYSTEVTKLTPTELVTETTDTLGYSAVSKKGRQPNMVGDKPVVILVNGNSASASELFTGAVKDNGRATVIGIRTFGKGIGQSSIRLPNGTQLHITSLRYFTPNGTWLGDGGNTQSHGIAPDMEVKPNKDLEFGESNDNQLDEAIEILRKKIGGVFFRPFIRSRYCCAA